MLRYEDLCALTITIYCRSVEVTIQYLTATTSTSKISEYTRQSTAVCLLLLTEYILRIEI